MRLVFIAPDAARARLRTELADAGHQVLSETSDRDIGLKMVAVLAPEVALADTGSDLGYALAWAEMAIASAPGLHMVLTGPYLSPDELLAVMRAGVREYLPEPSGEQILEAIARARPQPRAAEPAREKSGQVAVVYAPKGGSGKSTLAANLAVALFQVSGQRVQLMDLSLQFGDLDLLLNLQPQKTVADLIPVVHDMDTRALEQTLTPSPIGVRLLAAPVRLEDAEALREEHIERTFEVLRAQQGWTVVDTASQLDANNCKAIELADVVYIPLRLDLASIRRVARTFEVWKELGIDTAKVRLVAWSDKSEISAGDVARTLGRPIAHQLPWDPQAVAAAVNQGIPLMIGQPSTPLAQAIRTLAVQLCGYADESKAKEGGLARLVSSAFGWFKKKEEIKLLTAGSGVN